MFPFQKSSKRFHTTSTSTTPWKIQEKIQHTHTHTHTCINPSSLYRDFKTNHFHTEKKVREYLTSDMSKWKSRVFPGKALVERSQTRLMSS